MVRQRAGQTLPLFLLSLTFLASLSPAPLRAGGQALGPDLYEGVKALRRADAHEFARDNTGEGGDTYTKPTNVGLDILSALVAEEDKHASPQETLAHVLKVMDGVESLKTHRGIFPEYIKLDAGRVYTEEKDGQIRFSSIDSAWLHFALSVAEARYRADRPALALRMKKLLDQADYTVFLHGGGRLFRHGFTLSASTDAVVSVTPWPHNYDNKNSEARVLVPFLVAAGKLPETVWENMFYRWTRLEGLPLAEGWKMSAFVELTGNIYFDEPSLAPGTLGLSHRNYLKAAQKIAADRGFALYGWAPCYGPDDGYTEYGLTRPDAAAPYGAALLTTLDDAKAWENLEKMLQLSSLGNPQKPLPEALDSKTGEILNKRSLSLDQNLLYQAVRKDTVRKLVARTAWAKKARQFLKSMDRQHAQVFNR